MTNLEDLSGKELIVLAIKKGFTNWSKYKRAEIIEILKGNKMVPSTTPRSIQRKTTVKESFEPMRYRDFEIVPKTVEKNVEWNIYFLGDWYGKRNSLADAKFMIDDIVQEITKSKKPKSRKRI